MSFRRKASETQSKGARRWSCSKETRAFLSARATWALHEVIRALGKEAIGRKGIVLRILIALKPENGPAGWHQSFLHRLGIQNDELVWERYERFSDEKATRLMAHHGRQGHVSSWESRDDHMWRFGGAFIVSSAQIRGIGTNLKLLLSSSGLPEHGDEAFGLLVAKSMSWGADDEYTQIIATSRNNLARRLLNDFKQPF